MSHTPFGYRIENGKAVVNNEAAEQVKILFRSYLSGDSLDSAAKKAGIEAFHAGIGKILRNVHYLGDDYYPAIIDPDTFAAAQAERLSRAEHLGRIFESKEGKSKVSPHRIPFNDAIKQFDDPFQQAEYAYSLIEIEEH